MCDSKSLQSGWMECKKCANIVFPQPGAVCAGGESHDVSESKEIFSIPTSRGKGCFSQPGWRWCCKCSSLCFTAISGTPNHCPAGGKHDNTGSINYFTCTAKRHEDDCFVWCRNCGVLFCSEELSSSKCSATGGNHDMRGSGSYQISYQMK